jgi:peptidoglycan/xylan/chitin deacetylase (PgdA/CDA1 family)
MRHERFAQPVCALLAIGAVVLGVFALSLQARTHVHAEAAHAQSAPAIAEVPAWDGTYRRIRVPILMYHYISTPPAGAEAVRRELSVSPATFRAHLEYLYYQGYTTVDLATVRTALNTGRPLPPRPIVLTFDDGYADHYTNAFPLLRERGFTGTFFVITGRADANDPNHLSWEQIAAMADAGMAMESHTKDHPELVGRDYDFLVYQVMGSIESLAAYTGRTPTMLAYPVGRYDLYTLDVLETMPIEAAVTTERGDLHTTSGRLLMPRIRITGEMSAEALAAVLGGR